MKVAFFAVIASIGIAGCALPPPSAPQASATPQASSKERVTERGAPCKYKQECYTRQEWEVIREARLRGAVGRWPPAAEARKVTQSSAAGVAE